MTDDPATPATPATISESELDALDALIAASGHNMVDAKLILAHLHHAGWHLVQQPPPHWSIDFPGETGNAE